MSEEPRQSNQDLLPKDGKADEPTGPSPTLAAAPGAIGRSMPMALSITIGILLAGLLSWFLGPLAWFILLFYFSFALATILEVPVHFLNRKFRIPRGLLAGGLMVLTLAVLLGLAYLAVTGLYNESKDLAANLHNAPQKINEWVANFRGQHPEFRDALSHFDAQAMINKFTGEAQVQATAGAVLDRVPSLLEVLAYLVLTFFMTLYMSIDGPRYVKDIRRMLPRRQRLGATDVFDAMCRAHRGWFVANLINVVSSSILSSVGLWIVGTPGAILLGITAGLGELVPNIGPPAAAVPAILITLLSDPAKAPWVILMFMIVQTIQGYGISPLVLKHNIKLPPLATILAVLGMGILFGFLGVVVAVPLVADLVVLWNFVNSTMEKRRRSEDRDETNDPPGEEGGRH